MRALQSFEKLVKYLSVHTSYVSRRLEYSVLHSREKNGRSDNLGTPTVYSCVRRNSMTFFHVCKSPTVLRSVRSVSAFIASCRRARGLVSMLTGAWRVNNLFTGDRKFVAVFTGHWRLINIVIEFDEKLRRCKSHWLRRGTRITNNRMAKIMLNYGPNGRREPGRPLKRLLDAAETGLSRSN